MATLYEIAKITGYSIRTVRDFHKHGFLIVTESPSPILDGIRSNLKKGNKLTAIQQLHLLRNPETQNQFENWRYDIEAQLDKLKGLESVLDDAAPWEISSAIELAARREQGAIDKISNWLFSFIQDSEHFDKGATQDHAFIVVRLLANVPDHSLESLAKRAQACMWQCRRGSKLSECWKLNDKGQTLYFRPNKKALANFDL